MDEKTELLKKSNISPFQYPIEIIKYFYNRKIKSII